MDLELPLPLPSTPPSNSSPMSPPTPTTPSAPPPLPSRPRPLEIPTVPSPRSSSIQIIPPSPSQGTPSSPTVEEGISLNEPSPPIPPSLSRMKTPPPPTRALPLPPTLPPRPSSTPPPPTTTSHSPSPPTQNPPPPASLLSSTAPPTLPGGLESPPLPLIVIIALLTLLARLQFSWLTLAAVAGGSWYLWAFIRKSERERKEPPIGSEGVEGARRYKAMEEREREGEKLEWVNHVLRALFPMISTDILTPFIDLLEDALAQQVPPMVSSVRITSPSLGEEPVVLESMRVMSDEEWFENLSTAPTAPHSSTPATPRSPSPLQSPPPTRSGHTRSPSSSTLKSLLTRSKSRRDDARADSEVREDEVAGRRRRQGVLARIESESITGPSADPAAGGGGTGGGAEGGGEEQDPENEATTGTYVNYEIKFSYDGRRNREGWTLHFISYFGVGLRGVGGAEMPVWIDMLRLKGTLHLRILLSPSPPFVRTGSFCFPQLPEFDVAAKPMKSGFDTQKKRKWDGKLRDMVLMLGEDVVMKSIKEVADAFVCPKSYTMDLDRLLLGKDAALRTEAIGVLRITLHHASGLMSTDKIGSSDPYATVGFSKFNKPMFSTRTIVDSLSPRWEEDAFILVTGEHIASGERLQIRIVDSDRFSADDSLGMIETELADLISKGKNTPPHLYRRTDDLRPVHSGMKSQGSLEWSWGFFPLWKMPQDSKTDEKVAKEELSNSDLKATKNDAPVAGNTAQPSLIYTFLKGIAPEPFEWEEDRKKRRLESLAWLTGQAAREALEAAEPPSEDRRCGVLNFHIHQAADLELESLNGTFIKPAYKGSHSAAGGRPALEDTVDSASWENKRPPSAYCEVILNGRLIFRTRTKQLSPAPYWNASSERFIRDWGKAKLAIVVRDERDREHDPILGIVAFDLAAIFRSTSQVTRFYPIQGGIGWGRLRVSLLFKSIDMSLPAGVTGFELASVRLRKLSLCGFRGSGFKDIYASVETDSGRLDLFNQTAGDPKSPVAALEKRSSRSSFRRSMDSLRSEGAPGEFSWEVQDQAKILPVQYRQSCSLIIRFLAKNRALKKDTAIGMAVVRLCHVPDDEIFDEEIPVFAGDDINKTVEASLEYSRNRNYYSPTEEGSSDRPIPIAMVSIRFLLKSGVCRAHRKLTKKDKRILHVYEAWELITDMGDRRTSMPGHEREKAVKELIAGQPEDEGKPLGNDDDGDEEEEEEESSDDDDLVVNAEDQEGFRIEGSGDLLPGDDQRPEDDDETSESGYRRWRENSRALHRRNKGIMQTKLFRTSKFLRDKVQEKVLQGTSVATRNRREQGADLEVEMEGVSKIS